MAVAFALLALWCAGASPGLGQEAVDQQYQQAKSFFNVGKMEEACDLFKEVEAAKPGYQDTRTLLKVACAQVPRMQKMEEETFKEGVQLFNQGHYEDAKQKFDQSVKVPLKSPQYRTQALQYLKQIEGRVGEEKVFQEGVNFFNQQKYDEAKSRLSTVAQGGGAKAAEARSYLTKIEEAIRQQHAAASAAQALEQGIRLYKARNYADARAAFEQVAKQGGPQAREAQDYLGLIEKAQNQPARQEPVKNQAQPEEAAASDQTLRLGLTAYFAGDLSLANQYLSDYLNKKGQRQGLAYFFRGAAHSTLYFLSGEKDTQQKDMALADFRAVKDHGGQSQPLQKYVSPRILALYSTAIGSPAQ